MSGAVLTSLGDSALRSDANWMETLSPGIRNDSRFVCLEALGARAAVEGDTLLVNGCALPHFDPRKSLENALSLLSKTTFPISLSSLMMIVSL